MRYGSMNPQTPTHRHHNKKIKSENPQIHTIKSIKTNL